MNDLAAQANCSNSTIRDFEAGRRVPHKNRLGPIRQALEVAGIVFTGEDTDRPGIAGPRGVVTPQIEEPKKKPPGRKRPSGNKRKA